MKTWPITLSLPVGLTVGGVTTWALNLCNHLARAGRAVRLVVHAADEGYPPVCATHVNLDPRIRLIEAPPLKSPENWSQCVSLYHSLLPTILLPNVWAESFALGAALSAADAQAIRMVAWNHSDNAYDHTYLTYYESVIHHFLPVSRQCAGQLSRRLQHRPADITRLPYSVEIPPESPRPPLPGRPLRLVYGGRIEQHNKRVLDLAEVARALDARGVLFEFQFIGDGPQAEELQQRIAAIQPSLRIPGNRVMLEPSRPQHEMTEAWQRADVFLLASQFEGLSIAMLEAMAAGCVPVVSRVASGVSDIVRDGQNGFMFPVGDFNALVERLVWLYENPTCLPTLSAAANRAARELCDYDTYLARVLQVFDDVQVAPPRFWPNNRALLMYGAPDPARESPGCGVPADAATRMRRALQGVADRNEGPVAIYGAGRHTQHVAAALADSLVPICAILDDHQRTRPRTLWGWPVVPSDQIKNTSARSVIISSWMSENEIWTRHGRRLQAAGYSVVRLYADESPIESAADPECVLLECEAVTPGQP